MHGLNICYFQTIANNKCHVLFATVFKLFVFYSLPSYKNDVHIDRKMGTRADADPSEKNAGKMIVPEWWTCYFADLKSTEVDQEVEVKL